MIADAKVIKELVIKAHEFQSELSEADTLHCVIQFATLAASGFPLVAGFTLEVPEEKGIQVVFPAYDILSKVTDEDIADVEKRYRRKNGWKSAKITRGQFFGKGFNGDSYRVTLVYGEI